MAFFVITIVLKRTCYSQQSYGRRQNSKALRKICVDPTLTLLGTTPSLISAGLFPGSARLLPRVCAWRADGEIVLDGDDLEPADVYKPEVRQFSRLHPRR